MPSAWWGRSPSRKAAPPVRPAGVCCAAPSACYAAKRRWCAIATGGDIKAILESSPALKTIYEMRLELSAVWAKRGGSGEDLLGAFKAWCVAAEDTGIHALGEFVRDLKSYSAATA